MKENKELIIVTDKTALEAFSKSNGVKDILSEAQKEAEIFKQDADLSTDKSRKQIASNSRKFATLKVRLDGLGKGSTEKFRETIDKVNSNRSIVKVCLDKLRDEVRQPLTDWEEKEKNRVLKLEEAVQLIIECGSDNLNSIKLTIEELKLNLAYLDDLKINEKTFEEFELKARKVFEQSKKTVTQLISDEEKRISEQKELERLRKEKDALDAKQKQEAHDLKIKQEAEQKAKEEAIKVQLENEKKKREIEQEKQNAIQREKKAIQDKLEAEKREKQQAILAEENRIKAKKEAEINKEKAIQASKIEEQKRIDDEKESNRLEQAKLENNKKHVGNIRRQAKEALMASCGLDEDAAKKVVLAISNEKIANVKINY